MGAWALGMILYEGSPRRCSLEAASSICDSLRRRAELCGVFVNEHLDDVVGTARELGLTMIQLHGDEGPAYCLEAGRRSGAKVVKARQVSTPGDVREIERYRVDFHLLDARSRRQAGLRGGTGETFDWTLVSGRRSRVPLILSGGIEAGNAARAVAAVHPFALDSASGTESSPGHKDLGRMAALFAAVSEADAPAEMGQPA